MICPRRPPDCASPSERCSASFSIVEYLNSKVADSLRLSALASKLRSSTAIRDESPRSRKVLFVSRGCSLPNPSTPATCPRM